MIDSSVLILVPSHLCIQAHLNEQLDTKHLQRGVDHIETQKKQMKEPPMHKLQGQSIQMHAINYYMINLDKKKKTQIFVHHTSNLKCNMLLHGQQHKMFSADYLKCK